MNVKTPETVSATDRVLVETRLLDAPRELVWEAWTDPEHVARWWGPNGFTSTISEMNVKPGGLFRLVMHGPDGRDYKNKIVYLEVERPERLVYKHTGDEGTEPVNFEVTVTFADEDGRTRLTVSMLFPSAATREHVIRTYGADQGLRQTLSRLAEHLSTTPRQEEIVLSRVFDAPRELVFKAWTEPERLAQWWGPKGLAWAGCTLDLRPGGVFHYGMKAPDGTPVWGKFVYREIAPPGRLVFVISFADEKGDAVRHPMSPTWPLEVLNVLTLSEEAGRTTVTLRGSPINAIEVERRTFREGRRSMEQGFAGTWSQLDEYLAKELGR